MKKVKNNKINRIFLCFIMIMLAFFIKGSGISFAATWSSGNIAATTYSSNTTIDLTGSVTLTGLIQINSGATVTIQGNGTIKRGSSNTASMFKINEGGTLIIKGTTGNNNDIIIDGNSSIASCTGPLIDCYSKLTLNNVTLKNNVNTAGTAGGIHIRNKEITLNIDNSIISNCTSLAGSAIYLSGAWSGNVIVTKTIIENNYASDSGGTIRTNGGGNGKLTLQDSVIRNNSTQNFGGAVYWNANGANATLEVIDTQILNNTATERGGGFFLEGSKMIISASDGTATAAITSGNIPTEGIVGTLIQGNSASYGGGGIYISGYGGGAGVGMSGTDSFNLTLEENVVIQNNSAGLGEGVGFDLYQADPADGYTYNVTINGAQLYNNTATTYGGAICCKLNYDKYNVNVVMSAGTAWDNTAESGGAIYVSGGDFELSGTAEIKDCNATSGGGLNVSGGNVVINGGTISNCQASNGGGIYISNGDLTMNGGSISNNQATIYGGGIYASSDSQNLNLTITSGSIIGNIASINGGGVGINIAEGLSAAVTVGLKECMGLDETHSHPIIQDNTSNENGGGFWMSGDNMVMNMYCGTIENNLAIKEPGSSNIYQTGGNATVYGGTVGEGVIVIGGEYIYLPEDETTEVTIIYNSNIPEAEETKEALVTVGVEIYLPKTLFTRENYILAGWSKVQNPGVNDTIYEAGGPYVVTDESITIYAIWLKEGVGTIETPVINSGKCYDKITGGTNVMITSNYAITAQMAVTGVNPNLYTNRTLTFYKDLEVGTKITMIDLSLTSDRKHYFYEITNSTTNTIPLTSFTKNGGTEKYVESVTTEEIDETFLFILELPKESEITGLNQITLTRYSTDSEVAPIEQMVSFTTTEKRKFNFNGTTGENAIVGDTINFSYEKVEPVGADSHYENKLLTLIISGEMLSEEAQIYDGTNYYNMNSNGQYIIPFSSISESKTIDLQLISKTLSENEIGCNLNAELWVAANENLSNPCMGEKVAEVNNIILNSVSLPAINAEMNEKIYYSNDFSGSIDINYETKNIESYNDINLEIQKKTGNNLYETQTDILSSVNSVTENTNGVFNLELEENGKIDLEFTDNFNEGTYRVLFTITSSEDESHYIPLNFMVIE